MPDWFDQLGATVQPQAPAANVPSGAPVAPGVIYGRPKVKDPQDTALKDIQIQRGQADVATLPYDTRIAAANATKAEAEAAKAQSGADKSATEIDLEAKKEGAAKRAETVRAIMGNVRDLYQNDIQGKPLLRGFGLSEYIDALPKNERFTAAGRNILPLIRPLVAQTAKEGDSDREMLVFESYIPTADDSDLTIEGKLQALEVLIGGMVDGKSASEMEAELREKADTSKDGAITIGGRTYKAVRDDPPSENGPSIGERFMQGAGDVVAGIGDIAGMVGNPVNAGINAIAGTNLSTDLGTSLREALSLPQSEDQTVRAINRAGAGALGITSLAGAGARLATGPVQNALLTAAAQPGRQALAGAAAGGTGEQLRQEGASPLAQVGGSLLAGAGTYAGTNALMGLAARSAGAPNALAQAANRQGVDLLPADAGGATTRRLTGAAAQAPVSAAPIVNAAQRSTGQLRNATNRAASSQGEILDTVAAGDQVRAAGKLYIKNETSRISNMYERAKEASKGVRIKPLTANARIDEEISRLSELGNTNSGLISTLAKLKEDIADGVSVNGLRDARTSLSQGVFDGKLRSGQEKNVLRGVIDAISEDVTLGLQNAGRGGAATAFKRADALWKARIEQIDDILEPVIGAGKSSEDVFRAIENMTKGGSGGAARLSGLLREMPPEQAGNIRATIIDRLGKAAAGAQDDTGSAFSAATFLTNWNRMTPAAKARLFGDNNLRANLDDIAKLADATKQAGRYANHSNTSGGIMGNVGAIGAGAAFSPTLAATALTSQYLTGRLLASPRFASWLARAPKNPAAQGRYIEQLSTVAAREPAIAGDAQALQQHLQQTFGASPARAAASEEEPD